MNIIDRFNLADLHDFFRALVLRPNPPPEEIKPNSTALDLYDASLVGTKGSEEVLRAIRSNSQIQALFLAQNRLSQDGIRTLMAGLKKLRSNGIGNQIKEINLSTNHLTDDSLHLLVLHLLNSNPHPPTITHLYLNSNAVKLDYDVAVLLGKSISSPSSTLRCLSLTSNSTITSIEPFFSNLKLQNSRFEQLHLSVTNLNPGAVQPILDWLESESGDRIQILGLNGNSLTANGVIAIAKVVISGHCSGLLSLELLANEPSALLEIPTEWKAPIARLESEITEEDRTQWKEKLERALSRNKRVFKSTRLASLAMLAPARILLSGSSNFSVNVDHFRFLDLPSELQLEIISSIPLLAPSTEATLYPPRSPEGIILTSLPPSFSISAEPSTLSSALSERQFSRIMTYAMDRRTLAEEIRLSKNHVTSLDGIKVIESRNDALNERGEEKWAEHFLFVTRCNRFDRG